MKRYLLPALLLSVFFVAGRFWNELGVQAVGRGTGGAFGGNGDVNCDGTKDISDVVYLINALFLGGSPPCAAECTPPLGDICNEIKTMKERLDKLEQPKSWVAVAYTGTVRQTVGADGTPEIVEFDSVWRDTLGEFNLPSFTFKANEGGQYLIRLWVHWKIKDPNAYAKCSIKINNNIQPYWDFDGGPNGERITHFIRVAGLNKDDLVTGVLALFGTNTEEISYAEMEIVRLY